jgi:hypothetical protein
MLTGVVCLGNFSKCLKTSFFLEICEYLNFRIEGQKHVLSLHQTFSGHFFRKNFRLKKLSAKQFVFQMPTWDSIFF